MMALLTPEPESVALRDVSHAVAFDAFVSFHAGIEHIYVPFAGGLPRSIPDTRDSRSRADGRTPRHERAMLFLADRMAASVPYDHVSCR
jgi:hypothetical protein